MGWAWRDRRVEKRGRNAMNSLTKKTLLEELRKRKTEQALLSLKLRTAKSDYRLACRAVERIKAKIAKMEQGEG